MISMTVNGEQVSREVGAAPRCSFTSSATTLGLKGTHWGCDTSNCGACVVLMDGKPVKSCTVLAAMCEGHEIRTVESLEQRRRGSTRSSRASTSSTRSSAASARPG